MASGRGGASFDRFNFLLKQYGQWIISGNDRETCIIENHEIQLTQSRYGADLTILHPKWRIRGRIGTLRIEKGGRCQVRLHGGHFGDRLLLVLAPRETARLGEDMALRRERFSKWIARCCLDLFPGARVVRRTSRSPFQRDRLSGSFRLLLRFPGATIVLIALDKASGKEGGWSALSRGLSDYSELLIRDTQGKPIQLVFIAHRSAEARFRRLLRWINTCGMPVKLFSYRGKARPVLSETKGSVEPMAMRWPVVREYTTGQLLQRVLDSYGAMLRRFARPEGGTSFRFRGLDVLRSRKSGGELYFGPPDFGTLLNESSWPRFESFMTEVLRVRTFDSREKRHPFYTWQAERWLEEILLCDIERLDPGLRTDQLYSQVPAYIGNGRAVLDLLGVRSDGRLTVVELKVSRDPDFLVQALDYWDRVWCLNKEGEFQRRGFFTGTTLSHEKPLLYLVAPVFCFDRRLMAQARLLDPSMEIYRIDVTGDWRRELRIIQKKPLRSID